MTICSIFSRCLIVTSISQQRQQDGASIERPHLFHWPSPSLPLSIPIFSTGRPRILRFPCEIRVTNALHGRYFPLAIPIKSRQGPHLVKTTHSRAFSHRSDKTAPLSLWEMRAGAGAPAIFSEVELPLYGVLRSSFLEEVSTNESFLYLFSCHSAVETIPVGPDGPCHSAKRGPEP